MPLMPGDNQLHTGKVGGKTALVARHQFVVFHSGVRTNEEIRQHVGFSPMVSAVTEKRLAPKKQGLMGQGLDGEVEMGHQCFNFFDGVITDGTLGINDGVDHEGMVVIQAFQRTGAPFEPCALGIGQISDHTGIDEDDGHSVAPCERQDFLGAHAQNARFVGRAEATAPGRTGFCQIPASVFILDEFDLRFSGTNTHGIPDL